MTVTPSCLVLIWIVLACGLQPLEIGEVEGLLRICDELALFEFGHVVGQCV